MIDLSKKVDKPYEIRLEDKTILKLKKPTQGILIELARIQEMNKAEQSVDLIDRVRIMV